MPVLWFYILLKTKMSYHLTLARVALSTLISISVLVPSLSTAISSTCLLLDLSWLGCCCYCWSYLETPGKGEPQLKITPQQIHLEPCLWKLVSIDESNGRIQATVVHSIPRQMCLRWIRSLTELQPVSSPVKQCSLPPFCSNFCLSFWMMECVLGI